MWTAYFFILQFDSYLYINIGEENMSLGKYFKTVGDLFTYFNINISQEDIAPGLM